MTERRPAWSQESQFLQIPDLAQLERFSPEWALAGATGAGVRVAVIDSGIDADHPALGASIDEDQARDFSVDDEGNVVVTEGPHRDVFGHGTACAGIIHALAPEATITSVRVLGPGLRGKAAAFHAGLQWAVDEGFDVINLSLGAGKRDWALAFHDVCDRAYFSNSFIVTAANNVQRTSYPSLFAAVTSVACNTTDDPLRFHFNPNPPTEFLARGIDVEVPWLDGATTVTTGNSFAAPHISGFAALVRSKHPELRPFHVKAALWSCAANVRDATAVVDAAPGSTRALVAVGRGTQLHSPVALAPDDAAAEPNDRQPRDDEAAPAGANSTGSDDRALIERLEAELDDITIDGLLAHGAWGSVYHGTNADGGAVAVRRVDQALAGDPSLLERFVASVRTSSRLDHPHILPILRFIEAGDHAIIVMPRCPSNLSDLESPAPIEDACMAALSLLHGLHAAHSVGVFHGDVRAENSLVDERRRVVVSDVGLAAPLQANARTMVRFASGEWTHRSPELVLGHAVGPFTDVYAVGSLLFELLAGRPPHPPSDDFATLVERATRPGEIEALPTRVPREIADAVMPALVTDPAYRWGTVADFAASLSWAANAALGSEWSFRSRYIFSDPTTDSLHGQQRTFGR